MSFLTKLQNIADTRQEGIRKENRIVPVDDLRMILEHFVRLDKENRTDYHEAKQLRGQLAAANATIERKDKMLDLACCELEDYAERFYGHQRTKEQWLTWLEQQVKEGIPT